MRFITSISPKRIERQQYCMATWLQYGEIVAIQTADEIPMLQEQFPEVKFVSTDKTGKELFGYPSRVNISAMVEQGPGLLINSDIKFEQSYSSARSPFF